MILRIYFLIIKELLAAVKDPRARSLLIIPPILDIVVFSFAATLEVSNLTLAIQNLDMGKWGYEIVQQFSAASTYNKIINIDCENQIPIVLDEQLAIAVLTIPQDFSRNIEQGSNASVQLILDGRKPNTSQIVAGYAMKIVAEFHPQITGRQLTGNAVIVERNWFNSNLDYLWFTVPSMIGILSTLVTLLVTSLSVAREREVGTFEQLLVSPLRPVEILTGKAAAALLIGIIESSMILLIALYVFRIPFHGSYLVFYSALVVFMCSIIGIGLCNPSAT